MVVSRRRRAGRRQAHGWGRGRGWVSGAGSGWVSGAGSGWVTQWEPACLPVCLSFEQSPCSSFAHVLSGGAGTHRVGVSVNDVGVVGVPVGFAVLLLRRRVRSTEPHAVSGSSTATAAPAGEQQQQRQRWRQRRRQSAETTAAAVTAIAVATAAAAGPRPTCTRRRVSMIISRPKEVTEEEISRQGSAPTVAPVKPGRWVGGWVGGRTCEGWQPQNDVSHSGSVALSIITSGASTGA